MTDAPIVYFPLKVSNPLTRVRPTACRGTSAAFGRVCAFAATLILQPGCVHSSIPHSSLSSIGSLYSPAARVWIQTRVSGSEVIVSVDSGTIVVPGQQIVSARPAVTAVSLRAVLARTSRPKWNAVSSSASRSVADTLRFGESRSLRPFVLQLALPAGVRPEDVWLVLVIEGNALTASGTRDRVQTFVCSPWNLHGDSRDARRRADLMSKNYLRAC